MKKGEEIIIGYLVKVINGKPNEIIESIGFVGNIPSTKIDIVIGTNLNEKNMNLIIKNFNKLKGKYKGKQLINEIYKKSFNIDIKFDNFDITNLICNTVLDSTLISSIYLNKNNSFYNAILNKYWSSLLVIKYPYIKGKEPQNIYQLKSFGCEESERRSDFMYLESFKTGDILIYLNNDDITYNVDKNNNLIKNYITYEEGEYSFIYIKGKGFLGINQRTDNRSCRNEFNSNYYKNNKLILYTNSINTTNEELELANMLTLLGKDYYVILRPSLIFNFQKENSNNIFNVVLILIAILLIGCSFFVLWKYFVIKKEGKQFNQKNFKETLIF